MTKLMRAGKRHDCRPREEHQRVLAIPGMNAEKLGEVIAAGPAAAFRRG